MFTTQFNASSGAFRNSMIAASVLQRIPGAELGGHLGPLLPAAANQQVKIMLIIMLG